MLAPFGNPIYWFYAEISVVNNKFNRITLSEARR